MKWSLLFILFCGEASIAQNNTENLHKELKFLSASAGKILVVSNLNGSVKITGTDQEIVTVDIQKTIHAKNNEDIALGKKEIQAEYIIQGDSMILFITDPCVPFNPRNLNYGGNNFNNYCKRDYDYTMNYDVKVPRSIIVRLSTINNGDLEVAGLKNAVYAYNVNGSIRLKNLNKASIAHTINGEVDLEFDQNPDKECKFYSLNGDINAMFPPHLSANLSFKSFNGDLYTNLEPLTPLPAIITKTSKGNGIKYKVENSQYQIRQGGPHLDFETFNGNAYIKEKK